MICVIFATFVIYVAIITQSKAGKLKQQMAKSKCVMLNFGTHDHGLNVKSVTPQIKHCTFLLGRIFAAISCAIYFMVFFAVHTITGT